MRKRKALPTRRALLRLAFAWLALAEYSHVRLLVRGHLIHDRRRVSLPVYAAPYDRRRSLRLRHAVVAIHATLFSGLVFPVIWVFAR